MSQGRALFARGEYALAIEEFRKAVREAPQSPEGYNGLASAYDMIGRFDLASRNYELALAYAPDDGRIYRNMARSLRMQGRDGEAEALLAEWDAIKEKPSIAQQAASVSEEKTGNIAQLPIVTPVANEVASSLPNAPTPPMTIQPADVRLATDPQPVSRGKSIQIALDAPKSHAVSEAVKLKAQSMTPARIMIAPRSVAVKADAPAVVRTAAASAIRIMNAGARKGAAQKMQALLARNGTVSRIADADRRLAQSWIVYPKNARAEALALQGRLPIAVRTVADSRVRRVTLLLGQDAAAYLAKIGRSARRG
ncbi:LytR C-terminal domain-containing protein [Aquisediminimonas profunda]|uniref:LytR C-terminal domain-containing protein n=1 Tax=Aquisediminimonas profunda TaxID=1550733 RepID=UPI001C6277D4|nr:LytR C-terminal domain-containing protein [Aquisediminimonas profunda]